MACALALAGQAAARSPFPPHHRLWLCIQRYEARWHDHGPGHYGGLQMTWGWLGYIRGDAGRLPQAAQEWAAERAWRASGYAYSFLEQQWYRWDEADGCGASG